MSVCLARAENACGTSSSAELLGCLDLRSDELDAAELALDRLFTGTGGAMVVPGIEKSTSASVKRPTTPSQRP